MIVWTQSGLTDMLSDWVGIQSTAEGWMLRLYSNDVTPSALATPADFVESAFDGYEALPATDWGLPSIDSDGNAVIGSTGLYVFTKTLGAHPEFAYGWYITSMAGAVLLAERFPARAVFDAPGDDVQIRMQLVLGSCP